MQSNKVKYIPQYADFFDSLSSIKHLKILNKILEKDNLFMPVLIQVNVTDEAQKSGATGLLTIFPLPEEG